MLVIGKVIMFVLAELIELMLCELELNVEQVDLNMFVSDASCCADT